RRPPSAPPLFPYTTLFRSHGGELLPRRALAVRAWACADARDVATGRQSAGRARQFLLPQQRKAGALSGLGFRLAFRRLERYAGRSEEHTSELQSPYDLVCR